MDALLATNDAMVRVPGPRDRVHKDECAFTFDTPETEDGLFISLNSFLAFNKQFALLDHNKTGNTFYLNIKRKVIEKKEKEGDIQEPPKKKPTVLGIGVEGGFDVGETKPEYEESIALAILPSFTLIPLPAEGLPEKVQQSISAIVAAESAEHTEEVVAWVAGQDIQVSEYALTLVQLDNGKLIPPSGWRCEVADCDQTTNLWMNITDGTILCGRRQPDGSGGRGHALEHYKTTQYPLCVKLATITPEGGGDVYSYAEDDSVIDPLLPQHLAHFGINIGEMRKTEKTISELELDLQEEYDFNRIQEKGKNCVPLYGAGYTGLTNLGNSCYMASVMQMLFSIPDFQARYFEKRDNIIQNTNNPNSDFHSQMSKLAYGILSGKYSKAPTEQSDNMEIDEKKPTPRRQTAVRPRLFKTLIGAGHPEFSTPRQQDALEFYQHILSLVRQKERGYHPAPVSDPSSSLLFRVEDRIQCNSSQQVALTQRTDNIISLPVAFDKMLNADEFHAFEAKQKEAEEKGEKIDPKLLVRPIIPLKACIEEFASPEHIADFFSSAINAKTTATKTTRLSTMPDVLVFHIRKFVLGPRWEPKKLDISLQVPEELDLEWLRGKGLQEGEVALAESGGGAAAAPAVTANEEIVGQIEAMGFPRNRAIKAALAVQNSNAEDAMNWLFAHMDDPDIDSPISTGPSSSAPSASSGSPPPSDESVEMLTSMGFSRTQALAALKATDNNVERATDWIFSHAEELDTLATPDAPKLDDSCRDGSARYQLLGFISHIGTSTHSGHYVCHIRKEGRWVMFNDDNVALSEETPFDMGYLYFYQRKSE